MPFLIRGNGIPCFLKRKGRVARANAARERKSWRLKPPTPAAKRKEQPCDYKQSDNGDKAAAPAATAAVVMARGARRPGWTPETAWARAKAKAPPRAMMMVMRRRGHARAMMVPRAAMKTAGTMVPRAAMKTAGTMMPRAAVKAAGARPWPAAWPGAAASRPKNAGAGPSWRWPSKPTWAHAASWPSRASSSWSWHFDSSCCVK